MVIKLGVEEWKVDLRSVGHFEASIEKILKRKKMEKKLILPTKILMIERAGWLGPEYKHLQERRISSFTDERLSAVPR